MPHMLERTHVSDQPAAGVFLRERAGRCRSAAPKTQWPIALLKELIDNALDACETAGLPPAIEVTVEPDSVSVRDHGPGCRWRRWSGRSIIWSG